MPELDADVTSGCIVGAVEELWSVGRVAEIGGVSVRTLHHYDEIGPVCPSVRTAAGHRAYSAGDVERLREVLAYRRLGFGLREVAELVAHKPTDPGGHLLRLLRHSGAVVEARLTWQARGMSRHAPAGYACPFCVYVAGGGCDRVGQEHVVERTESTLTYVSPKWWPRNPGNVLVIPTAHLENLYELPDTLGTPMQRAVRRAASALKSAYGCDGVSTRQHNEPAGNQDVWHYHVHVYPRWADDELYLSVGEWADRDAMTQRAAQVRRAYADLDATG